MYLMSGFDPISSTLFWFPVRCPIMLSSLFRLCLVSLTCLSMLIRAWNKALLDDLLYYFIYTFHALFLLYNLSFWCSFMRRVLDCAHDPPSILPKISHKIHFSLKPSLIMHMATFSSPPSQPFIPTETISTPTTFIKPIFSHHHISITLLTTFSINLTHPLVARSYAPLRRPYAPTETSKNCRSWLGTTAWTSWTNLGCSLGSHMTTFGTRESA